MNIPACRKTELHRENIQERAGRGVGSFKYFCRASKPLLRRHTEIQQVDEQ